ncbi:MAG: PIN domain-containing protein [Acidimicrobiales bacterium]
MKLVENQLPSLFGFGAWMSEFNTDRYWQIEQGVEPRTMDQQHRVQSEIEWQIGRVENAVRALGPIVDQESMGALGAVRAILDTNIYLHYKPLHDILWLNVLDAPSVRVIVPLAVVRELDDKKNYASGRLSRRADDRLKLLRKLLDDGRGPTAIPKRRGVTIEVPLGFDDLDRRNVDEAILTVTSMLNGRGSPGAILVTGDYSMQLRARAQGLDVKILEDDYRLPLQSH